MNATCANSSAWNEYVVSYGLTGELGRFPGPEGLQRGDRVVVDTPRGREIGEILRLASARLRQWLGSWAQGAIVRRSTPEDEAEAQRQRQRAEAFRDALPGLLDAEILLDGQAIYVQAAGPQLPQLQVQATQLAEQWGLRLTLYNAGLPLPSPQDETGCGSGGCGSGGCGSGGCGSGGCGSGSLEEKSGCNPGHCGGERSEVRAYFASLRQRMEHSRRVTLL
ncbi:MAG: hypothetical protein SNJ82_10725 [Gemmataceae bacterium]